MNKGIAYPFFCIYTSTHKFDEDELAAFHGLCHAEILETKSE
jgi:hypothetical protein